MTSEGLRNNCQVKFVTGSSNTIANTVKLQKTGFPKTSQPTKSIESKARGTRLLRRLSKIFHRESVDSGFLWILRSEPGTKGVHQLAICQSPLIHRCLRCISVRYDEGYSSYSCTSVTNPDRE